MIKKFLKIKNFGSFKNYIADSNLNEFKKYNLFFGLNGTGKTTLSTLFRCLNDGLISKDLDGNSFKEDFDILLDNDGHISEFQENIYCNYIKIFNRDFVNNNLTMDSNNAQTQALTYTIGESAKGIKNKISELNKNLSNYYTEVKGRKVLVSQNDYDNKQHELDEIYKISAEKIRFDLQIKNAPAYNLTHFRQAYPQFASSNDVITEIAKNENVNTYIQPVKNNISPMNIEVISNDIVSKIQTLLSTVIKRADIKEELVQWLEKGITFDDTDKICPFCNNPIKNWKQRYNDIQNIVKKDDNYLEYEKNLNIFQSSLNRSLELIKKQTFSLRTDDFCNNVSQDILDDYAILYNNYQNFLENLINLLNQKKVTPDKTFNVENVSIIEQFINIKDKVNQLIVEHNTNVDNNVSIKNNAKDMVIQYYVQECKDSVLNLINQLNDLDCKIKQDKIAVSKIENDIKNLNAELTNQKAPMTEIEKYLFAVFGHKKFTLQYDENTKSYSIYRDNEYIAKNLSEGEKTVIAFAYFLATLKSHNFDLKNAIVVIDDPVSSLDQQYLFNLINLLTKKFNKSNAFGQLFVMTHNFYFYKKLRDAFISNNKEIVELFHINKNTTSYIENADKYLRSYTSEYTHTIKYLKQVLEMDDESVKDIPIGNSIRKVLEIFLAFKCPTNKSIYTRYMAVTKNLLEEEQCNYRYLESIANATSHTEETEDIEALEEFKLFVTKKEIEQLFAFIKLIDEAHYNEITKL